MAYLHSVLLHGTFQIGCLVGVVMATSVGFVVGVVGALVEHSLVLKVGLIG